ncbi:MAG: hypothetical protein M1826_002621 [Phylliscum demangeonii]|nr:MAG: hypothetical protein M1826_002621 [Phylliscum demangeonii]
MPIIQGLEVRIESGGSFLPEHSTLEGTTTETENHATQYIEISPGATFSVYLMTTEAFEYERGDGLRVVVYFDDQRGVRYDLSKLQVQPFRKNMLEHLGCLPQTPHLLESDEEDETVDTSGSRAALVESDSNREEGSPAVVEVPANSGLTAEEEQELIEVEARSAVLHQKRKRADACPKHDTDLTPAEAVASQPHLPRALKRERREVVDLTMD